MKNYQLELRQIVDYPRCRIYREFIQTLIADRSIRTGGGSGLFYYVVLCAYANFRTSYRRIDGISYTVYPGEWICSITDITEWFRVRFHYQAFAILKSLQDRQLITFTRLGRGHIVKFSITQSCWSWCATSGISAAFTGQPMNIRQKSSARLRTSFNAASAMITMLP